MVVKFSSYVKKQKGSLSLSERDVDRAFKGIIFQTAEISSIYVRMFHKGGHHLA